MAYPRAVRDFMELSIDHGTDDDRDCSMRRTLFVQISQHNLVQATYIRKPGTLAHRNLPSEHY